MLDNNKVKNWICMSSKQDDAYYYLINTRNNRLDKYDSNLVAAERYMSTYVNSYNYGSIKYLPDPILISGQHILKNIRRIPGVDSLLGANGSPASDSSFTTKWGLIGSFDRYRGLNIRVGEDCDCK